jgi:hypothetical protein
MSPGHNPRRERSEEHNEQPAASGPERASDLPPDMLREIVAQTAESLSAPEQVDPALVAAMTAVARRFAGQPIAVDPVGTALLEAVLRIQLPILVERPALLSRTARVVATSLLADPAARLRVEHLWARLAEEAP